MVAPRAFRELVDDYAANPTRWRVIKTERKPSTNARNKGGASVQEVLENIDGGETLVRHTLLWADGTVFQPSHFRPYWK
ncbi:MAG: hypothetical protein B7Z73_07845 [Planctomycetia bacterium 21-64-5]|nr:MAG: hypothetical protein B7Z73_07845 [Planctomycetia bacterium 21-64-5]